MSKNSKQRNKQQKDVKAQFVPQPPNLESNAWWADEKRARNVKRIKDQSKKGDHDGDN